MLFGWKRQALHSRLEPAAASQSELDALPDSAFAAHLEFKAKEKTMRFSPPLLPISIVVRIERRDVNWRLSCGLRPLMAAIVVAAVVSALWLVPHREGYLRQAAWYGIQEDYQSRKVERWRAAMARAEANLRAADELDVDSGRKPGVGIPSDHEHDLFIFKNCPAWLAEDKSRLDNFRRLKQKYMRAACYPWVLVSPDPPPPSDFH